MSFPIDKSKLPRHKLEELKRKEDEKLTKEVFQEFVASFDEPSRVGKTFVRGGVVNPDGSKMSKEDMKKPQLYKPTPTLWKPPATTLHPSPAAPKIEKPSHRYAEPPPPESLFDKAKRTAEEKAQRMMEEATRQKPPKPTKKKEEKEKSGPSKKMTNLEIFKEELKRNQEERAERQKLREQLKAQLGPETAEKICAFSNDTNSTDSDPNTTNLYLSNLSPNMNEDMLSKLFGKYGPIATIKVMWPRTDEEKARGYLTGFVAFMTRVDGERALYGERGRDVMGFEMKMGWGKAVPIPANPVYIPPSMMDLMLPPAPSGLPFNAQPLDDEQRDLYTWPLPQPGAPPPPVEEGQREAWEKLIENSVVKVVIPTERPLLQLIHRMTEFVLREGPMFEAMIMNRELQNPQFRFLFDNQSPAHVYYRWKLLSLLQGDTPTSWRTDDFVMFCGGSKWRPPPMSFFQQGMPPELYIERDRPRVKHHHESEIGRTDDDEEAEGGRGAARRRRRSGGERDEERKSGRRGSDDEEGGSEESGSRRSSRSKRRRRSRSRSRSPTAAEVKAAAAEKRKHLSGSQRDKFEDMLRNLTPESELIAEAMFYCVSHAEAAEEIVDCIADSLALDETPLGKKIARLYLVVDILANCTAKVPSVSYFRKFFWQKLEAIFENIARTYKNISARLKAEQFKTRVMACFHAWEDSAIYPLDYLIRLQNIFLGLIEVSSAVAASAEKQRGADADIDGVPLDSSASGVANDDIDGVPLGDVETVAARPPQARVGGLVPTDYGADDIDGVPLDGKQTPDGAEPTQPSRAARPSASASTSKPALVAAPTATFVRSKWETIDPDDDPKLAMSSKWESAAAADAEEEDIDGVPLDEADLAASPQRRGDERATASASLSRSSRSDEKKDEERRVKLREIEVKVMKFQDELESGRRRGTRSSIAAEVEEYRESLLAKLHRSRSRSSSPKSGKSGGRSRKRSTSRSPSPRESGEKRKKHKRGR